MIPTGARAWIGVGYRRFGPVAVLSVVAGAVSGVGTVWLLSIVNRALNSGDGMTGGLLLAFGGLCAVTVMARAVSDIATNLIGQRLVAEVRLWLGRRVIGAPIEALERYRSHRILPILTHDVDMISDIAYITAPLAIAILVAAGCFAYLAWLSPPLFLVVLAVLGLGLWAQYAARRKGIAGFEAARSGEDDLHKAYRTICDGAKELKINRERRERVLAHGIADTVHRIRAINTRAINIFVVANAVGAALFFIVIAIALVWHRLAPMAPEVLSGFVLVVLYLRGPIDQIMGMLPAIGRAQVAFRRIADLSTHFATTEPDIGGTGGHTGGDAGREPTRIRLEGVTYDFPAPEGGSPFTLGPIDLVFEVGAVTFIVGDNGSGKTTLIKLLLGLYQPRSGRILINDTPVTEGSRDDYRQRFSTVLTDFHLFDDVIDVPAASADVVAAHLERLELAHKVGLKEGRFTSIDLSTGQRKRLALVHAWLEDRPVVVFDEWAADQDPAFRRLFYEELLPGMKARGKTVIVVSHDDRFFGVADRVVRMAGGTVVRDADRATMERARQG